MNFTIYQWLSLIIAPLFLVLYSIVLLVFRKNHTILKTILALLNAVLMIVQMVLYHQEIHEYFYSTLGSIGCQMVQKNIPYNIRPEITSGMRETFASKEESDEISSDAVDRIYKVGSAANILVCPSCDVGTTGGRQLYFEYTPDSERFITSETCQACQG